MLKTLLNTLYLKRQTTFKNYSLLADMNIANKLRALSSDPLREQFFNKVIATLERAYALLEENELEVKGSIQDVRLTAIRDGVSKMPTIVPAHKIGRHLISQYYRLLFSVLNSPTLNYANYVIQRDLKILKKLGISSFDVCFKSVYINEVTPQLYARFLTRRLAQRFTLFESFKVLRPYLLDAGLKGYLIRSSGRFSKKQRASIYTFRSGQMPIGTFSSTVEYYSEHIKLKYGACCIKV